MSTLAEILLKSILKGNLQSDSDDEPNFRPEKADRSKCLRRRDFNLLYIRHCRKI